MAAVNAVRSKARDAVFAGGGRGFVRFLPDGEEALLVSDAPRRCQNPSALLCACGAAGFGAEERDGLLLLTPTEETLRSLNLPRAIDVDWASADAPLAAFAARLMHRGDRPLTENGLRFAVETLRLLWQDDAHVRCGLPALRARAAACGFTTTAVFSLPGRCWPNDVKSKRMELNCGHNPKKEVAAMKLEWIGHACFRMTAEDGTVIVTDPYDDSVGIRVPKLAAELVTMSHDHHDHNNLAMIAGRPQVARGEETAQIHGVATRAVGSYHDDRGGALRGRNNVRIFRIDALKVVHMGDQGCMPDETVMQAILDADVMMIPVGGFYTIDAKGAKAIIEQARPKCVIPMHYKTAHCTYPIAGVEPFLGAMGAENVKPVRELEVRPGNVPEGVVVMEALEEWA